jgi:hypothetical protein
MDGNAAFGVKMEGITASAETSAKVGPSDPFGNISNNMNIAFRDDMQGGNPIAGLLLKWIIATAAILGTCAAAWAGRLFLTPVQMVAQAMPDLIALLVFFLVLRLR